MLPMHVFRSLVQKMGQKDAIAFLKQPHPHFSGKTPEYLIKKGQTSRVENLIREMVAPSKY